MIMQPSDKSFPPVDILNFIKIECLLQAEKFNEGFVEQLKIIHLEVDKPVVIKIQIIVMFIVVRSYLM